MLAALMVSDVVNPFMSEGFPIDEYNRLALDRVQSISVMSVPTDLKGLITEWIVIIAVKQIE